MFSGGQDGAVSIWEWAHATQVSTVRLFSFSSFSFGHTKTVSVLGLLGFLPRSTELSSHNKAISLVSVMAMETQRFGRYLSIHMLQSNFNFSLNLILDHLHCRLLPLQCPSSQCRHMERTRPTLSSRSLSPDSTKCFLFCHF